MEPQTYMLLCVCAACISAGITGYFFRITICRYRINRFLRRNAENGTIDSDTFVHALLRITL